MTNGPARWRQAVPRPAGAEVVAPAASFVHRGSQLASALSSLGRVERALAGARYEAGGETGAMAAVLLALLGGSGSGAPGEVRLALIRRATHLTANPGEIAFPGGRLEPGETAFDAAVREAFEEVGLPPASVRLLGPLPAVARASRPGAIAPFVAAVEGMPTLSPNPAEVDELLVVPLSRLADPSLYWEEVWSFPCGREWRMSFFDLGGDLIWGASARILVSLFEILAG